ncbi:UNVERIFIED_CONTAM: hypothetical protein FKN15_056972 [Acipenser sinensis]
MISCDLIARPPAVTYTTSYKKTPPPVPPRTTSKPLISVTAQSSTESTQDAYHDSRHQRGGLWPLDIRGMYNSTDSLDSTKAVTLAMETAAGKRHASTDSHSSVLTSDKGILVKKGDEFLKSRRSSIGIQVETATDSESEGRGLREYHSVGVQVEDKNRHGRFKRSNSVTAAVQADLELEGFPGHVTMEDKGLQFGGSFQRHSEPSTPTQYGAVRTVRTQGLFSYREDYRAPVELPSPQPDPWLVESPREVVETGRLSPCRRDGSWFMQLLHAETKRMEGWCKEMEREAEENDLSEETVTYTTSYKKTPPPVPPRTTSKPLISVTAQSSTESTQDAYHDSRHQRGGLWPLDIRGMYNSTDSLDSTKAVTLAMETAAGKRHASTDSHSSVLTSDKGILVKKGDEFLKSRRSSIGIQVETATDSESEGRGLREYHSVGVQVEDKNRHGRFKRSNSVTAAVQADLELEGFPGHVTMEDKGLQFGGSFQRHSEPSTPTQYGAVRTVRTQGLFSYREDYRAPVELPSPQPDPWLVESPREVVETGRLSPCRRDGSWFMQLLHAETKRMEGWCKEMEREAEENDLSEESK